MSARDIFGVNKRNRALILELNPAKDFSFADSKALCKQWLMGHGIPVPELLGLLGTPQEVDEFLTTVNEPCGFVVKPNRGRRGQGVRVIERAFCPDEGVARLRGDLRWLMLRILAGEFVSVHTRDFVLVEERMEGPGVFSDQCGCQGSDIRVLSCEGRVLLAMLRLPTRKSAFRSNLHQGAVGVGVDMKTGVTTHGIHHEKAVTHHPDTGLPLAGIQIPGWQEKILPIAETIAREFPLKFHGIDVMLNPAGEPRVMEINARPGLAIQLANRVGLRKLLAGLLTAGVLCGLPVLQTRAQEAPSSAERVERERGAEEEDGPVADSTLKLGELQKLVQKNPQDAVLRNDLGVALWHAGRAGEAIQIMKQAVALKEDYDRVHFNLGTFYLKQGRYDEARTALKRATELDPLYTEAFYNLGLTLMKQGDYEEGAKRFRAITRISRAHRHYQAWYNLGLCLSALENYAAAEAAYREARNLKPDHVPTLINLGHVLSRQDKLDEARAFYERSLRLDRDNWLALYNLAVVLFGAEQYGEALEAIQRMPANERETRSQVLGLMGNIYMDMKRPHDAIPAFQKAFKLSDEVRYLYGMGRAHSEVGSFKAAIQYYRRVLERDPDQVDAALSLAIVYENDRNFLEAEKVLLELIRRKPAHAEGYYRLGMLFEDAGSPVNALPHLKKATRLAPTVYKYWFGLALAQRKSGHLEEAAEQYRKAIQLNADEPGVLLNLGVIYVELKKLDEAVEIYSRALDLDPDYFQALYNRAKAYADQGNYEDAVRDFLAADRLNPNDSRVWNELGQTYKAWGEAYQDKALEAYSRAIKYDPKNDKAYFNLSLWYQERGRANDVMKIYNIALRNGAISPNLLTDLAESYEDVGDLVTARKYLSKALAMNPGHLNALIRLTGILSREGKWKEVKELLNPFFSRGRATAKMHYNMGMAYMRTEQFEQAAERFNSALSQANGRYIEARHNLGLCLIWLDEPKRAATVLKPLLDVGESVLEKLLNLALAQSLSKDYEGAMETLRSLIKFKPDSHRAYFTMGVILAKQRNPEAVNWYRKAVALEKNYPEAWLNLGRELARDRKYDEAIAAYQQALRYRPDYPEAHYNIGVLYSKTKDPKMIAAYQKAIKLDPDNAGYYESLGRGLEILDQFDEAVVAYVKAMELHDFKDKKLSSRLSYCLNKSGQYAKAEALFSDLVDNYPQNEKFKFNFAVLKARVKDDVGAEKLLKEVLALSEKHVKAMNNLAYVYMRLDKLDKAEEMLTRLKEVEPDYPNLRSTLADLARAKEGESLKYDLHQRMERLE